MSMSRNKKMLFGCLGGCGFVVLVFVGSCIGLTVWLNSPGEVLDPDILLGPETVGYVEWTLRLEDPGTGAFADAFLDQMSRLSQAGNSPLPDGLERIINGQQMRSARKDMKKLFPIVLAWTAQPGEAINEEEHLVSVSARGASHQMAFFDWIAGFFIGRAPDVEVSRYKGEKIYLFPETNGLHPAVFVRRGIGFVATDLESARHTVDRLARPDDRRPASAEWQSLFDGLPEDRPLRGALTNGDGVLLRIVETLGLPEAFLESPIWTEATGATLSAAFVEGSVFAGTVELHGPDTRWAEAHADRAGAAVSTLIQKREIKFDVESAARGNRIRIDFTSKELLGRIEAAADRLDRN